MSGDDFKLQRRAIAAAAFVVLIFSLLSPPMEEQPIEGPASSLRGGPGGTMAFFEVIDDLGFDSRRRYDEVDEFLELQVEGGVYCLLAPTDLLTYEESNKLIEWVRQGGTLLYAPRSEGETLLEELEVELVGSMDLDVSARSTDNRLARRILKGVRRTGYPLPKQLLTSEANGFVPLIASEDGLASCALLARGSGRVLLLSDIRPLTNTALDDSPLIAVVVRALAALESGERVYFDEYHHGYKGDQDPAIATWRWLSRTSGGRAVLTLALIGFISLITSGLRLGKPVPIRPKARRSSLEHVDALAVAYRASNALKLPSNRLVDGLRIRLGTSDFDRTLRQTEASFPELVEAVDGVRKVWHNPEAASEVGLVELAAFIDRILIAYRLVLTPKQNS